MRSAGPGVDAQGNQVIDPTRNVLDVINAERRYHDVLRDADNRYQNAMREAETRRINELMAQKQASDLEAARVLRQSQEDKSTLLATQLQEVKRDLSERTSKLEQFRWETGGRGTGRTDFLGWIVAGAVIAGAIIAAIAKFTT